MWKKGVFYEKKKQSTLDRFLRAVDFVIGRCRGASHLASGKQRLDIR
jgi:hypothetical protein